MVISVGAKNTISHKTNSSPCLPSKQTDLKLFNWNENIKHWWIFVVHCWDSMSIFFTISHCEYRCEWSNFCLMYVETVVLNNRQRSADKLYTTRMWHGISNEMRCTLHNLKQLTTKKRYLKLTRFILAYETGFPITVVLSRYRRGKAKGRRRRININKLKFTIELRVYESSAHIINLYVLANKRIFQHFKCYFYFFFFCLLLNRS